MKILRIITRLNVGGPAIQAVLLTRDLRRLGYETILVAGCCEEQEGDMSYLLRPDDPVLWLRDMSRSVAPLRNLRALRRLCGVMRAVRPQVVHTHTAMAGFLGRVAARLAGVPVVIHTFHGNSLRGYFSPAAAGLFLRVERLLARATDAICVVSEEQLEELSGALRVAPRSKFRVVPLGLDLDACLGLEPPARHDGCLRIGWVGRLVAVKNVPLLLAVAEQTLRRTDKVEFLVAGDGPERGRLQEAAARFGKRFVWLGWQKDVASVLSRCDLMMQTSVNEGTPAALIEGMAAARPFLSTAAGGVVDMVCGAPWRSQDGCRWYANGVLADATPAAFGAALAGFLDEPGRITTMGSSARDFAAREYRKESLCARLDALYRELIARKAAQTAAGSRPVCPARQGDLP
ncbi:MAG TPA: glycosyltransferase [Bryobacterales bacterium]|nr:glycosyltransferase [Bryobacterales bacterium]